jgi:hypothetical protein
LLGGSTVLRCLLCGLFGFQSGLFRGLTFLIS